MPIDRIPSAGIESGGVAISNLSATGTPSATTFLRGDNTWAEVGSFPAGTVMMFVQTAAPTGWTKSTTHDNKALRVVSGTASSGGSVAFTTAFASQSVAGTIGNTTATNQATTLSESQIPSHSHGPPQGTNMTGYIGSLSAGGTVLASGSAARVNNVVVTQSGLTGGGGSHNHTQDAHNHTFTGTAINLAVQYVDVIIATKD